MERKVGEVIKLERYGERHLSDFFEDADKLADNDYIRGCYRPGDIIDDCRNTMESIIEALDFVTRPEVKEIMDEAIEHSQKANMKHLMKHMLLVKMVILSFY